MSKGSNIRPRKVPKERYDDNWDRIFGELKDAPLRGGKVTVKKFDDQLEKPIAESRGSEKVNGSTDR